MKKSREKVEEETEKARENKVTENRLRSVIFASNIPYLQLDVSILFKFSQRRLNCDPFVVPV